MSYGHFDDASRSYVVTNPTTPKPYINYLGNRKLACFISQNAGGMMWYLETEARRLTRYHYLAGPGDRPGFYVYIRDRSTGAVWNPHFAPTCAALNSFQCRHSPGVTSFVSTRDAIAAAVDYVIPVDDNVLLMNVTLTNNAAQLASLQIASFMEFGILETARESWWCYLQRQMHLTFDPHLQCIRHNYKVFEALYSPKMSVGCTEPVAGFDCSRDAFLGRSGHYGDPEALRPGREMSNSELPIGGHACGALGVNVELAPGASKKLAFIFTMGDDWQQSDALLAKYRDMANVQAAIDAQRDFWQRRLGVLTASTGDEVVDRFVNTWNPYHAMTIAALPCSVSADHMGIDGLRYRDTTQYCLAPANIDPPFVVEWMDPLFASQKKDGQGSYIFWPHLKRPASDALKRSDNTVWQAYTIRNVIDETGDLSYLDRRVPYRDGGDDTVYRHVLGGLKYLADNLGPQGMPLMFYADWNDCLVLWQGPTTQSVMLAMQMEHACKLWADVADRIGRSADADWCRRQAAGLDRSINQHAWDGKWYRRLVMGPDKFLGSQSDVEGKLWINSQTWAVLCGAGDTDGRGRTAMEMVHRHLDSPAGLFKQWPVIGSDPSTARKTGSPAGIGEYGGVFNHTQTWAVMAQVMLGNGQRAFDYYRRTIPQVVCERFGAEHYQREPYAYASSLVGPIHPLFGQGGISWITGTASWMYLAATHYILGIRPGLDGLAVRPCLPASLGSVRVQRLFRGCMYDIRIDNALGGHIQLEVDGKAISGDVIPLQSKDRCEVRCRT